MIGILLAAVLGQAPAPAADDPAQLARVRKALEHQHAITTEAGADEAGRPVFRMNVRAKKPEKPLWDNWTNVPSYIRPWWRGYHYEFLEMVTPEEFRGPTLFPCCIPIIPLLELRERHNRAALRKAQEKRAREEVHQALAELFACRADPSKPGC